MAYEFLKLSDLVKEAALEDRGAAMAFFLMDQGVGINGKWSGHLQAADQRVLFGKVFGKGKILINGGVGKVEHIVKVGFGQDFEIADSAKWAELV